MGLITDGLFGWLGAKEQSKAADKSAQASQQATQETLNFLRETRDQTRSDQAPWRQTGVNALNRLNMLYGFSAPSPNTVPTPTPNTIPPQGGQTGGSSGPFGGLFGGILGALSPQQYQQLQQTYPNLQLPAQGTPSTVPAQPPVSQQQQTMNWLAMDPGYQFRLTEGANAVNTNYAGRGLYNSGAAAKAMQKYGQDYASGEFNNAYNRLSNLAGLGQTANQQMQQAGQAFASGAGNTLMQNAQNLGSSYQQKGNAWSGFYGGLNGSLNSYGNMLAMAM